MRPRVMRPREYYRTRYLYAGWVVGFRADDCLVQFHRFDSVGTARIAQESTGS